MQSVIGELSISCNPKHWPPLHVSPPAHDFVKNIATAAVFRKKKAHPSRLYLSLGRVR
jgi:hypothetical protein